MQMVCIEARMDLVLEVAPYVLGTLIFDLSTTGPQIACVML